MVYIHASEKKLMLRQTNLKKIIVQCLYFQFAVNVFQRILYNEMFRFFLDKDLISANQSGFKPRDSCINQLLSITHNI